jgi:two-component system, NtrC family, response regulator AtoC
MSHTLLVIDDDANTCELLAGRLDPSKFAVFWTTQPEQAEGMLRERAFDIVLTDSRMQRLDGIELCARLVEKYPGVPVVVMTAFGSMDMAVNAMRAGASDFLTKPVDVELFSLTLERAIMHASLRREVVELRREQRMVNQYGELVGSSHAMQSVYQMVERAAPSDASVLISGESGTGKEVLARTIAAKSARASGPFVAINCAALPEPLLESELFGHTRGAFTDAHTAREGLLAQANHGTLFLDEVGDLPLALQPKLLRVLQERVVRPIGSDKEVPVDVRLICATNCDLESAIAERRFRADLYYRINVIHITLPRLAVRGDDVLVLARHFLGRFGRDKSADALGLSADAERLLAAYPWPGNVRELANCMERAVVLARGRSIAADDLPEKIREYRPGQVQGAGVEGTELVALEEIERRYILRVLDAMHGNKSRAAQVLGLDRKTLYRRLERYGATSNGQSPSAPALADAGADVRH